MSRDKMWLEDLADMKGKEIKAALELVKRAAEFEKAKKESAFRIEEMLARAESAQKPKDKVPERPKEFGQFS